MRYISWFTAPLYSWTGCRLGYQQVEKRGILYVSVRLILDS